MPLRPAMNTETDRTAQFVMKMSKLCNLRCRYCYEMKELANPVVMALGDLRRIYRHIRDHYAARDAADGQRTLIRFIWHGGEPLLVDADYYWQTFADQREIFGTELAVKNSAQTNLTVL